MSMVVITADILISSKFFMDDEAVKALSILMHEKDNSKDHFQHVYGTLYREFGVTSYKNIPQSKFKAVMEFLDEWRKSLV